MTKKSIAEHIPEFDESIKEKMSKYDDPVKLRNYMANAKDNGRDDYYWFAFQRLCEIEGINISNKIENMDKSNSLNREFCVALAAYEEQLAEKHGRRQPASYTRRKLKNKGVIQCLEEWAIGPKTPGFDLLMRNGQPELTGEYLVTKYPEHFSEQAIKMAKDKLADYHIYPFGDDLKADS